MQEGTENQQQDPESCEPPLSVSLDDIRAYRRGFTLSSSSGGGKSSLTVMMIRQALLRLRDEQ